MNNNISKDSCKEPEQLEQGRRGYVQCFWQHPQSEREQDGEPGALATVSGTSGWRWRPESAQSQEILRGVHES
jgi:hypothetical protein